MAEKRMFSNKITQSDAFLAMPATSQNLYFHLSMDADDDGFVNRPKAIMRMINSNDDDLNILIVRKFVIPFEVVDQDNLVNMICVIKHWFIHNTIRADRKKDTTYTKELGMLIQGQNKAYSLKSDMSEIPLQPSDNQVSTDCLHRLDKNRLDKNRLDKSKYGECANVLLSDVEALKLIERIGETKANDFIDRLDLYIEQSGKKYKSHYATILNWYRRDEKKSSNDKGNSDKPNPIYEAEVINDYYEDPKTIELRKQLEKEIGEIK